jgi:hypothetical protein
MVCCGHFKVFKSGLMLVIATFRLGFDLDILALLGSANVLATFPNIGRFSNLLVTLSKEPRQA